MIGRLVTTLRRRSAGDAGAALVEFAISLPLFILLVLGITDYGAAMYTTADLLGATRAGAEYARANWLKASSTFDPTTPTQSQVCAFSGLTLSGSTCSPVTPSAAEVCTCADGTGVTCPTDNSNPCSANLAGPRLLKYVAVGANQTYQPWLPAIALPLIGDPALQLPGSPSVQSVVRLQ